MVIIDINDTIENIDTGIFQVWTATKCGRPCAISKKSSGIGILCCFVPYNHNTDVCGNMISAKMLAMSPDRTLVNISLHVQRYRLIRVVWRSIDSSMSMDTIRQDRFLEKGGGRVHSRSICSQDPKFVIVPYQIPGPNGTRGSFAGLTSTQNRLRGIHALASQDAPRSASDR